MLKKVVYLFICFIVFVLILTTLANFVVNYSTKSFLSNSIKDVQPNSIGLLLGTSKYVKKGVKNLYFFNRIDACVELYKNNKIKKIIISGDNSTIYYNEPVDMKMELLKRGVPDSIIYLDHAGLRTLDAVLRARDIFGQYSYIIVSQKFHNQRAVYLARKFGINAFAYNAKDVSLDIGFRTMVREFFARDKMFIDLLFDKKPKHKGVRINIDN